LHHELVKLYRPLIMPPFLPIKIGFNEARKKILDRQAWRLVAAGAGG
jgi:hypothetical protein